MKDRVLDGQRIKGSKFQLAMAAAKRSKQLNRMAKERGLPPNQVALINTGLIKPPTIALMEINEGKIAFSYNERVKKDEVLDNSLSEESSEDTKDINIITSS